MKLHIGLHEIHHLSDRSKTYRAEIYAQPTWRRIVAGVYHWYDMRIFKVPGFRQLEAWLEHRHQGDPLLYVPLSARHDIRCYSLSEAGRKVVARLNVTEEQYKAIKAERGRAVW